MKYMLMGAVMLLPGRAAAQDELQARYMDSLTVAEFNIFHNPDVDRKKYFNPAVKKELETKSMVLFTPMTFYHSPASHLLGAGVNERGDTAVNRMLDRTLMNVYLNRPDLVVMKEKTLDERGVVDQKAAETPQQYHPNIIDKVEPLPDDPQPMQFELLVTKPNFWDFSSDLSMQFMQNYISSNWYKGGESNYSMMGNVLLRANYNNKQKVKWENILEVKLGAQTSKADTVHNFKVTSDMLRLTSKLGLQATKKWYYTLQVVGTTQTMHTYGTNSSDVLAAWFSPFTLNASVGMDYSVDVFKGKLKGSVHLAPFAANWKYVDRVELASRYGITQGHHDLFDYGSEFTADLQWKFSDNIAWKTRLYGYTTYSRSELEWENTFVFKFNRYISTNLFVYPRFDDAAKYDSSNGYWQLKEYFSLGFNYSF